MVSTQSSTAQHDPLSRPFNPAIQAKSAPRCSARPGWHQTVNSRAPRNRATDLLDMERVTEVVGELRVEPHTVAFSLEELWQAALDARPDVLAAQRSVEAVRRTLDLAYAQRHRDIDVVLEYQRVGSDNTIGATVSFPLFLS